MYLLKKNVLYNGVNLKYYVFELLILRVRVLFLLIVKKSEILIIKRIILKE